MKRTLTPSSIAKTFFTFLFVFLANFTLLKASNYYWVGGSGNWSDYAQHWATTSGGQVFHVQVPGPNDDVFFDGNSFLNSNDSLYIEQNIYCKNLYFTAVTNIPVITSSVMGYVFFNAYGSIYFSPNMVWSIPFSNLIFEATNATKYLNTSGINLQGAHIQFKGSNDSYSLLDSLTCGSLDISSHFFTNGNSIRAGRIEINDTSTVYLDTSKIWTGDFWAFVNSPSYIDADSSEIYIDGEAGTYNTIYHNIHLSPIGNVYFNECSVDYIESINTDYGIAIAGESNTRFKKIFCTNDAVVGVDNSSSVGFGKFTSNLSFSGNIDSLILDIPGKVFTTGDTLTVNSLLQISGSCNNFATIKSSSNLQAYVSSNGIVNISSSLIQNVNAIGSANFLASNSFTMGNASGWNITNPIARNLYWVGGTGEWNDNTHWATSSGASGGNCVPSPFDNVFFDNNSFLNSNDTLFLNYDVYCKNIDFSNVQNLPTVTSFNNVTLKVYGSMYLNNNIIWNMPNTNIHFESTDSIKYFNPNGLNLFGTNFRFQGNDDNYYLLDSITCESLTISSKFFTNNNSIRAGRIDIIDSAIVHLGTSKIWVGNLWTFAQSPSYVDADSTDIYIGDESGVININFHNIYLSSIGNIYFNECSVDYIESLNLEGIEQIIGESNTHFKKILCTNDASIAIDNSSSIGYGFFSAGLGIGSYGESHINIDSLILNNPGKNLTISSEDTLTINNLFQITGSCNNFATIKSSSNLQAYVSSNGIVNISSSLIQNVNAIGSANFLASNSFTMGNASGWNITNPIARDLYWVGGTGEWNDNTHWATSSGASGGNCVPSPFDNVYFDNNSFLNSNDTLFLNNNVYCKNIDFSNVQNLPTVTSFNNVTLKVYGSMYLNNNIIWNMPNTNIHFESTDSIKYFNPNGLSLFGTNFRFQGNNDSYYLLDSIVCGSLNISSHFITNGYSIRAGLIDINYFSNVDLGTSKIWTGDFWAFVQSQSSIDADSADIYIDGEAGTYNTIYHNIHLSPIGNIYFNECSVDYIESINSGGVAQIIGESNTYFKKIFCTNNAIVSIDNSSSVGFGYFTSNLSFSGNIDSLILSNPGIVLTISSGDTLTINNLFQVNGNGSFPVLMHSSSQGSTTYLSKPLDTVCVNYIILEDVHAIGGAVFYAGANSQDLGNNTGWQFQSCIQPISDIWPGDANSDLVANNFDVLSIGVAYNEMGVTRIGASTNWIAQPCLDWFAQFADSVNINHADCNGDGTINAADTNAVAINYGQIHSKTSSTSTVGGDELYLVVPIGTLTGGTAVSVPVNLGTSVNPADSIYGIAFTINYPTNMIEPGSISVSYNGSWLANTNILVHLEKDFSAAGQLDVGVSRINHQDNNGFGTIATLNFTIANGANGLLNLDFSDIKIISHSEIEMPYTITNGTILTAINENNLNSLIQIYPNPSNDFINVNASGLNIETISLCNAQGQILYNGKGTNTKIDVSGFKAGYYILSLKTNKGTVSKAVSVFR